jgi:beta-N-acetylhexosaminidase
MTNSISLQAKVGQLVAVGIHGTALSDANIQQVIKQAEAGEIGGVIIYRYNITSKVQLTTLLQGIQQARTALPLFVYVDQEGGKIQRIDSSHGFVETLAAQQVATDLSIDEALEHYAELGRELQHTGFNFDLAPCVDIDGEPLARLLARCNAVMVQIRHRWLTTGKPCWQAWAPMVCWVA